MPSHSFEQRTRVILRLLDERERVTVAELTRLFAASEVTIRQDLAQLEGQGRLTRVRGAAIRRSAVVDQGGFDLRLGQRVPEKRAIAAAAARLVRDGSSVALDSSTTAYYVALELRARKDLVVMTSGLRVANLLSALPRTTVIVPGGRIRSSSQSIVGDFGGGFAGRGRVDVGFFGATSVSAEHGYLEIDSDEAIIKRRLMEICDTVVGIFDSAKARRLALTPFAPPGEAHMTISDTGLPADIVESLRAAGQEVILVDVPAAAAQDPPEVALVEPEGEPV
jgi:DeoR/GlpR family transcriptional regulator of sugar metabolism